MSVLEAGRSSVVARSSASSSRPASNSGPSVLRSPSRPISVTPRAFAYAMPVRVSASAACGPSKGPSVRSRGCCAGWRLRGLVRRWWRVGSPRACPRFRGVADVRARRAAIAERPRRALESSSSASVSARSADADGGVGHALERLCARDLAERFDQRGAGRERFEQRERLEGSSAQRDRPRETARRSACHRVGLGWQVAACVEGGDRLLQRLFRVAVSAGVLGGLGEADESVRPVRVAVGVSASARSRLVSAAVGVQPERAFSGEREEPPRRVFQRRLPGLPVRRRGRGQGRWRSGRRARLRRSSTRSGACDFDPGGGGDVAGGARCAGELGVGDVSGEDVPEGVFGLALHRRVA